MQVSVSHYAPSYSPPIDLLCMFVDCWNKLEKQWCELNQTQKENLPALFILSLRHSVKSLLRGRHAVRYYLQEFS